MIYSWYSQLPTNRNSTGQILKQEIVTGDNLQIHKRKLTNVTNLPTSPPAIFFYSELVETAGKTDVHEV